MPVPGVLPVLLGGDANVYGMARSFWEALGVRSAAVRRRAPPVGGGALAVAAPPGNRPNDKLHAGASGGGEGGRKN